MRVGNGRGWGINMRTMIGFIMVSVNNGQWLDDLVNGQDDLFLLVNAKASVY